MHALISDPPFIIGLDLGQRRDFTALTIVRPEVEEGLSAQGQRGKDALANSVSTKDAATADSRPACGLARYHVRHVHRFKLGTPYKRIATHVKSLQERPPLLEAGTVVVTDVTGLGLPVFEELKSVGVENLTGVTIHGGRRLTRTSHQGRPVYRVPKRALAATLQVLTRRGALRVAKGVAHRDALFAEMANFQVKIDSATGHDRYEARREGDHDDLVVALGLACWYGEYQRRQTAPVAPVITVRRNA